MKSAKALPLKSSVGLSDDLVKLVALKLMRRALGDRKIDYGTTLAALDPEAHMLPELLGAIFRKSQFGPAVRFLGHALVLQQEGLIPENLDLCAYVAVASCLHIPPECVLLSLLLRGAQEKIRLLQT